MTTQSIIVYRNPAEAMLWEGGYVFPLMAGLGAGFILFLLLMWLAGKVIDMRRHGNAAIAVAGIVSLGTAFTVFNHLML